MSRNQESLATWSGPIFIFEIANNHMGSVEHGLRIISEIDSATRSFRSQVSLGFKLQYRDLDTFIHPDWRGRDDVKYVKRFRETRLTEGELRRLRDEISGRGFIPVCTPFDEPSVDLLERHEFSVLKIASCSLTDWPLLERVALTGKPIVASVGGNPIEDIDRVVSFFQHRKKDFALLHCVAEYPTADEHLELNQIDFLKERYPSVRIGYSTHEHPENTTAVQMAIAKGATIFEKHVGVRGGSCQLNAYSADPEQIVRWLSAACGALRSCGIRGRRSEASDAELTNLSGLRRGVFAGRELLPGEQISTSNAFLAIPTTPGQVTANDLSKYVDVTVETAIPARRPVLWSDVSRTHRQDRIYAIVRRVRSMIAGAGIVVPGQAEFEISHHYGIDRFDEVGAVLISFINREYCKKLIILLPGQKHPEHYHKQKEETFLILSGEMHIDLGGQHKTCGRGDILVVERGVAHSFSTETGAIMEEVSSAHQKSDSFYTDAAVPPTSKRKTVITYWLDAEAASVKS